MGAEEGTLRLLLQRAAGRGFAPEGTRRRTASHAGLRRWTRICTRRDETTNCEPCRITIPIKEAVGGKHIRENHWLQGRFPRDRGSRFLLDGRPQACRLPRAVDEEARR